LEDYSKEETELLPMDKWVLCKLKRTTDEASGYLERYEIGLALNTIEKFFWDFCDNYIEIVKDRLYKPEVYGNAARLSGQKASYTALLMLLKLFAPYFPHITEEIYQEYFREKEGNVSIHATTFDDLSLYDDEKLIGNGEEIKKIISEVRKYKSENNLSLKTELEYIQIECREDIKNFIQAIEYDLKSTCKCREIRYIDSHGEIKIELKTIDA